MKVGEIVREKNPLQISKFYLNGNQTNNGVAEIIIRRFIHDPFI